jgi:hypothetical protein
MKITKAQLRQIIKEEIDSLTEMDDDEQLIAINNLLNAASEPVMNAINQAAKAAPKDPQIKINVIEFLENLVSKAESMIPDPETDNLELVIP